MDLCSIPTLIFLREKNADDFLVFLNFKQVFSSFLLKESFVIGENNSLESDVSFWQHLCLNCHNINSSKVKYLIFCLTVQ